MNKIPTDEIIDSVLRLSVTDCTYYWEIRELVEQTVFGEKSEDDIYELRRVIEQIIKEEHLLTKYDAGWKVNAKTKEINESGGYIQYIARQRKRNELQEEADEARNRTAIIQRKTIKWSFGMSIAAIFIAFAALIVSIISIAKTM